MDNKIKNMNVRWDEVSLIQMQAPIPDSKYYTSTGPVKVKNVRTFRFRDAQSSLCVRFRIDDDDTTLSAFTK
jgi:hypothetical protein